MAMRSFRPSGGTRTFKPVSIPKAPHVPKPSMLKPSQVKMPPVPKQANPLARGVASPSGKVSSPTGSPPGRLVGRRMSIAESSGYTGSAQLAKAPVSPVSPVQLPPTPAGYEPIV